EDTEGLPFVVLLVGGASGLGQSDGLLAILCRSGHRHAAGEDLLILVDDGRAIVVGGCREIPAEPAAEGGPVPAEPRAGGPRRAGRPRGGPPGAGMFLEPGRREQVMALELCPHSRPAGRLHGGRNSLKGAPGSNW